MKIENQVCTLEQAKRLQELGVDAESVYYFSPWEYFDGETLFIGQKCDKGFFHCLDGEVETFTAKEVYPAFTVAELGLMLPAGYDTMQTTAEGWRCYDTNGNDVVKDFIYATESECRAAAVIHLLESNLTTVQEVNSKLKQV